MTKTIPFNTSEGDGGAALEKRLKPCKPN